MAGGKPLPIASLPYRARVYMNNQVLIPARLARALGLNGSVAWVDVTLEYRGFTIELRGVRLLKPSRGKTSTRQFTIPRHVREEFGIGGCGFITTTQQTTEHKQHRQSRTTSTTAKNNTKVNPPSSSTHPHFIPNFWGDPLRAQ